jgi:hypothetical protein
MIRPATVLLAIALAFGLPGGSGVSVHTDSERASFASACEYYRLRGQPDRAHGAREFQNFDAFLADACAAALNSLDAGTANQRRHAELLLSRIVLLRKTVDQMNADRAASSDYRMQDRPRVTGTGEFLIAHRMGLLIIYDAWLDTGVEVSLASYP